MDSSYKVMVTNHAYDQIYDTVRYIAHNLMEPNTALKWLDEMELSIKSLAVMPGRIALTEEEPWKSYGIHRMLVKNHNVYFWVDTSNAIVWVTAVIYSRRNQKKQLQEMSI